MPYLFTQRICFMQNTCLSSGSLEFWYVLGRCCLHDQPQDVESLVNFHESTFHICCHNFLLGELSTHFVTSVRDDPWKLTPCSPWTLQHVLLPFADCVLYPLTSHGILVAMSIIVCWVICPLSESLILMVVLEIPSILFNLVTC